MQRLCGLSLDIYEDVVDGFARVAHAQGDLDLVVATGLERWERHLQIGGLDTAWPRASKTRRQPWPCTSIASRAQINP